MLVTALHKAARCSEGIKFRSSAMPVVWSHGIDSLRNCVSQRWHCFLQDHDIDTAAYNEGSSHVRAISLP